MLGILEDRLAVFVCRHPLFERVGDTGLACARDRIPFRDAIRLTSLFRNYLVRCRNRLAIRKTEQDPR